MENKSNTIIIDNQSNDETSFLKENFMTSLTSNKKDK